MLTFLLLNLNYLLLLNLDCYYLFSLFLILYTYLSIYKTQRIFSFHWFLRKYFSNEVLDITFNIILKIVKKKKQAWTHHL